MAAATIKTVIRSMTTVFLSVLPLAGIVWLMGVERFLRTFTVVLSGQIFGDSWNRIHAGSALDQPTIGKWYFWFTVFTIFSLPYLAALRRFIAVKTRLELWVTRLVTTVLCVFVLCLLTIPFFWLTQYINAMGWTGKRLLGLFYGMSGYVVVLLFWWWVVRIKKTNTIGDDDGKMSAL